MAPSRRSPLWKLLQALSFVVVLLAFTGAAAPDLSADERKAPASVDALKEVPENVQDLKALQEQVKKVLAKVMPATVCVRIGQTQGSGVIVSKDGYVLTAGHVSGQADRDVSLVLPNGKTVKGKTLGGNQSIDSGLIKISEGSDWPFVEMGNAADLKPGQWCIATGHPGGFRPGRTPPVRVGRVLRVNKIIITTDCALVGGDSGGPLFDLQGKVIGIHSRIGGTMDNNIHVPVDTYRDTWDRLVKAEIWGGRSSSSATAYMGVQGDPEAKECRITGVLSNSPAEKAGVKVDDIITRFEKHPITRYDDLVAQIAKKKPGDEVTVEIVRGETSLSLRVTLGKR